jgi:hypothetical protein
MKENFWDYTKKVAKILAEDRDENYANRIVIADIDAVAKCFDDDQTPFFAALVLMRRKEQLPK